MLIRILKRNLIEKNHLKSDAFAPAPCICLINKFNDDIINLVGEFLKVVENEGHL